MACTGCGESVMAGARFCSVCGRSVAVAAVPPPPMAASDRRLGHAGKLVRPREGRMVAGVCRGLADHLGWDVTIVRLVVALAALFAGIPALVYLVAWVVIPNGQHALPAHTTMGAGSMGV